jgi:hypothetical protein
MSMQETGETSTATYIGWVRRASGGRWQPAVSGSTYADAYDRLLDCVRDVAGSLDLMVVRKGESPPPLRVRSARPAGGGR